MTMIAGTSPDTTGAYFDIHALAAHLRQHKRSVYRAIRRGELPPGRKVGGRRLWTAEEIGRAVAAAPCVAV